MIDQCHSETDIVNCIFPYIIVINFKIFYNEEMVPAGVIRDPLGTCSSVTDILKKCMFGFDAEIIFWIEWQGPVVQSVVSLTSSLRVISFNCFRGFNVQYSDIFC